ncbi:hypothetical protein BDW74DRAFT_168105 [Aspergillus multicolor]|uniref:uncharacterized protein n=1 Tax=Aspergillus multicolor TaxID=41759 RepID=UPI003CCCF0A7
MHSTSSFGTPLRWRKRPQRPPVPFVEDEVDSLSRELDGSSHVGELPGVEGVKARGTVNQSPLIEDIEVLKVPKRSSNDEKTSHGSRSSGFYADRTNTMDAKGPKQNPIRRPAGHSPQGSGKPSQRNQPTFQEVPVKQPSESLSEPQASFSGSGQKPTQHPEIAPQTSNDLPAPRLPPRTTPDVVQKSQPAPIRSTSLHRGPESRKADSPTRYAQPEPARNAGVRTSSPAKHMPDVAERSHSVPSRPPPLRHAQEQQKSGSPTRFGQAEPARYNAAPQPQTVPSRTSSVRRDNDERRPTLTTIAPRSEPAGVPKVSAGSLPPAIPGVVQKSQAPPPRPAPVPQEIQNKAPHTVPHQPVPTRETSARGPALPPKQMHDTTRQTQSTVPRPLPTPPDDEQRKPRPSSASYKPEVIFPDSGVRVEKILPRSSPDVPPTIQRPLSEKVQYKSFASSITPPPDTPPITTAIPLQSFPLRSVPLHPLPNPPAEGRRSRPSPSMKESASVKQTPAVQASPNELRSGTSGYVSDSAANHQDPVPRPTNRSPPLPIERDSTSSPGSSVAERLEEKLKLRREQRELGDNPSNLTVQPPAQQPRTSSSSASQRPERKAPPGAWPSELHSETSSSSLTEFPTLEQMPEETKPPAKVAPLKSALRSQSLDRGQQSSAKVARRRTVAFAENPLEYPSTALVKVDHETALAQVRSHEDGSPNPSRSSSPNTGLTLSPCPRSVPVAGYQDWHTIEGLSHLNICPSCIKQMRKTKFRDRLVLSAPRPRDEPIGCAMSEPWTRLAWMQTLKKKYETLDLLLEITRPSNTQGTKSCTGRIINEQYWYRIIDPDTGLSLPQFNICSACVRNVRLLMPAHRDTFQRSTTPQERVCDFVTDSPRFIRYIDALDLASNRAGQDDARPDLKEFLAYARRKVVLRDCRRSRLIFNTWHYMPQLPEFTVCEDCYDDIVWPLAKARHPIAREFSSVMRLLPGDTGSGDPKFNDAVRRDDLPFIKWMALTRYDAERRFRARQDELLEDQRRGYECSMDLRKNLEDWKRYE